MNNQTSKTIGKEAMKYIEENLPPSQMLQISGRAAIDIARNELEFMYTKMRQKEDEINAQQVQIRILNEKNEQREDELVKLKEKVEAMEDDWESNALDFGDLHLRYVLAKGLCVGLSSALAAMWWFNSN